MSIYIYIYIYQFESHLTFDHVLNKQKIVLKAHLISKIFRFLYRSFVSLIKI